MRARAPLAVALLLTSFSVAEAAPRAQVPGGAFAGRERERFVDPFPQRDRAAPVITTQQKPKQKLRKQRHKTKRSR